MHRGLLGLVLQIDVSTNHVMLVHAVIKLGCLFTCPRIAPCSCFGRLYSLDWSGVDWTGLEWTGLTQKSVKCLFQCRTEVKHTYSVTKVACTACFRVFARVGRGQRSRAYLMSFSNELQSSRG